MNVFPAIRLLQPLGEFYLTALPVNFLLKVCFSDRYTRKDSDELGLVTDSGHQRNLDKKRLKEIASYLQTQDAVFPGTIILAANSMRGGGVLPSDDEDRWRVEQINAIDGEIVNLVIPCDKKLAAVVDGQHRLWGFSSDDLPENLREMSLPCAVFVDIPTPQQAAIFATINFNQKPVSKSMTYELFGYDLDEKTENSWSPDKLAVFFSRKLNVDTVSPFKDHIKVAAQECEVLDEIARARKIWAVSAATIVEGILSLISRNPKEDRARLNQKEFGSSSRKKVLNLGIKPPPFRELYLAEDRDVVIYKTLLNFFNAVHNLFWANLTVDSKSLIRKTAGVQALFQVLKELTPSQLAKKDIQQSTWEAILEKAKTLDFADITVFESSGRGRARIRDAILVVVGIKKLDEIQDSRFRNYLEKMLGDSANA